MICWGIFVVVVLMFLISLMMMLMDGDVVVQVLHSSFSMLMSLRMPAPPPRARGIRRHRLGGSVCTRVCTTMHELLGYFRRRHSDVSDFTDDDDVVDALHWYRLLPFLLVQLPLGVALLAA